MTRPFAVIGFTYLITLIILCVTNFNVAVALGIVSAFGLLLALIIKRNKRAVILSTIFLSITVACFSYGYNYIKSIVPVSSLSDMKINIYGEIQDEPTFSNDKYYYIIKVEKTNLVDAVSNFRIRISSKTKFEAEAFDKISMVVQTYSPWENSKISSKTSYYAKSIYVCGYAISDPEIVYVEEKPFMYNFIKIRKYIKSTIYNIFPNEIGGLLIGVLIGEKSYISNNTINNFRTTGVSHLLAVSGLHLSTFAFLWFAFLKRIFASKKIASIGGVFGVLFFMAITGFTPSISRAGIMMIIYFAASVFFSQSDSINSLGISVFVLTVINPFSALDVGLLLSFSSTLGILLISPFTTKLSEKIKTDINKRVISKPICKITEIAIISFVASLFTMPVIMLTFGEFSLISVLTNVLVCYPTTLLMTLSGVSLVFSAIPFLGFAHASLAFLSGVLAKYVIKCVDILANIPFASVTVTQPFLIFWMISAVLSFAFVLFFKHGKHMLRLAALMTALSLFLGIISYQFVNFNVANVCVLDVGYGTCVCVSKGKNAIIIGCGGESLPSVILNNHLKNCGIKNIEFLILPTVKKSESSGVKELCTNNQINSIIVSNTQETDNFLNSNREISTQPIKVNNANLKAFENIEIEMFFYENYDYTYVKIGDTDFLISTSELNEINTMPKYFLDPTVFITTSTNMSDIIDYDYIVVSTNEDEIMNTYNKSENIIFTANLGNVNLYTRGNSDITVKRSD